MAVNSSATTNLKMLTPEELIAYKKKPNVHVLSLGQKESVSTEFDSKLLNTKLANMEQLLSIQRVKMKGQLSRGVWRPDVNKAEITHKIGPCWDTLGHYSDSKLYVHPEEALYLVDTSALELSYNDVTFSLQRAYHILLHETGISLDFYRVYAYLSLLGYKVIRHCVKNVLNVNCPENREDCSTTHIPTNVLKKSEEEILARLRENGPRKFSRQNSNRLPDFDVFQPDTAKFRKSTVQFRITVRNSSQPVGNFNEICQFSDNVPLISAIVYPDFINFLQIETVCLPIVT